MKQPNYLPRPGDLGRKELVALAERTILQYGGPTNARVFFKFTCVYCGTRCTLVEPNSLPNNGTCAHCGEDQPITCGGIRLQLKITGA